MPRHRSVCDRLSLIAVAFVPLAAAALGDTTPQPLPFSQTWMDWSLITVDDDWSEVPGIIGYRGDDLVTTVGVDPQTIVADGATTPVDVNANQFSPNTLTIGGLAEFQIVMSAVAIRGSDTADAPHMVIALNTIGMSDIKVRYVLADLDTTSNNAISPVALQYRVGSRGRYTNVPSGFVADATTGPGHGQATMVAVTLPGEVDNQEEVQVRIMTTDAAGNDEWVGITNIIVVGVPIAGCPANVASKGSSANVVDIDDLLAVIGAWGPCPAPPAACPANIVNGGGSAGVVNIDDLLAVISAWGLCHVPWSAQE